MPRLPIPGGDQGNWGDILNDYLKTEHNDDGTHKASAVPDASGTTKGKLKLAGDLGGTADSPTVPAVGAHTSASNNAHPASAITFTPAGTVAATDVQAAIEEVASEAGSGVALSNTAPSALSDPASAGSAGTAARADHVHPLTGLATDTELSNHATATTGIHGVGASSVESTSGSQAKVDTHNSDTTSVHGVADTSLLETTTGSQAKVDAHAGAADPHTGYQKESEKGAASGYASLDSGTKVPTTELGGAGADNTKFLRGDQSWAVPSGGAPPDATYITTTSDATLSAEKVLGADIIMRGTLAARPAAGTAGRIYVTTDDIQAAYRDNGSSWDQITLGQNEPALQRVAKAGTLVGTRHRVNFIEGSNVTLTVADDGPGDEVDVTIAASGGGGSGWELLGSAFLSGNANTVGAVTIAARDILQIVIRLTGYDVADIPALQFNSDPGTNYCDRHLNANAGSATFGNVERLSADRLSLSFGNGTRPRTITVTVNNHVSTNKSASIVVGSGSSSAAAAPLLQLGSGMWANTSAQITQVQLITQGANNMLAGTGLLVFGKNL
ncbi:MAG: hypothetical protein V4702_01160 [Patescibacteria group bacterium]